VLKTRVLAQRACNHSAVETYRYDADGKLKAAEKDITTWEERNTEIYGWLNSEAPPFEPRQPVNRFRSNIENSPNDPTKAADYEALLDRMARQVHAVPPQKSTTVVSAEQHKTNEQQQPDVVLRSNSTRVDGLRRSLSEHCVTYKSSVQSTGEKQSQTALSNVANGSPATARKGRLMWSPSAASAPAGNVVKKPGFIKPSPVGRRVGGDIGIAYGVNVDSATNKTQQVPSLTSLAERQRKRCMENRMRKAAGKSNTHLHYPAAAAAASPSAVATRRVWEKLLTGSLMKFVTRINR
jgi:hypothetical protein